MIELYDTFNTKGCPDELIFGDFNDQPISSDYYNFLNNDNDDENNIPGTLVEDDLPGNKVAEDAVVQNNNNIINDVMFDDDDSLVS